MNRRTVAIGAISFTSALVAGTVFNAYDNLSDRYADERAFASSLQAENAAQAERISAQENALQDQSMTISDLEGSNAALRTELENANDSGFFEGLGRRLDGGASAAGGVVTDAGGWVVENAAPLAVGAGLTAGALCLGYQVPVWVVTGGWYAIPGTATCAGVLL